LIVNSVNEIECVRPQAPALLFSAVRCRWRCVPFRTRRNQLNSQLMFGRLFRVEHIGRAPSPLSRVECLIEGADVVSYDEWRSGAAHTQLFPYAFISSSSDRLGPSTASHIEWDLLLSVRSNQTEELVRAVARSRPPRVFHIIRYSGEPVGTPMLLDQTKCACAHQLRRCTDHRSGLYVLDAVNCTEQCFERIDGRVRMIRPQSVGLHVTYDKRCNGRHIFNAVRELFQDVSRCLRVRGAMTGIAEVRKHRAVWTAFQMLAGKRGFMGNVCRLARTSPAEA
jgi:hypothetical protein